MAKRSFLPQVEADPVIEHVDSEGDEVFGLYDIVYFITGGPAMAITEFVGKTRCTCKWFTANDVLMTHNFEFASLTHGEDMEDE